MREVSAYLLIRVCTRSYRVGFYKKSRVMVRGHITQESPSIALSPLKCYFLDAIDLFGNDHFYHSISSPDIRLNLRPNFLLVFLFFIPSFFDPIVCHKHHQISCDFIFKVFSYFQRGLITLFLHPVLLIQRIF